MTLADMDDPSYTSVCEIFIEHLDQRSLSLLDRMLDRYRRHSFEDKLDIT